MADSDRTHFAPGSYTLPLEGSSVCLSSPGCQDHHHHTQPMRCGLFAQQYDALESQYLEDSNPSFNTQRQLANKLNLSLGEVNRWLHNRRATSKQDVECQTGADELNAQLTSSITSQRVPIEQRWTGDKSDSSNTSSPRHSTSDSRPSDDESTSGLLEDLEKGEVHVESNADQDPTSDEVKKNAHSLAKEIEEFNIGSMVIYAIVHMVLLLLLIVTGSVNHFPSVTSWIFAGMGVAIVIGATMSAPEPMRPWVALLMGQLMYMAISTLLKSVQDG